MPELFIGVFSAVWFAISIMCLVYVWVKLKPEFSNGVNDRDKGYLKLILLHSIISLVVSGFALGSVIIL